MRNLKRALSLALASVMLLGMMVVGTSAASYTDVSSEDNVEAIEVLNAVKVMIGKQGNFDPDAKVNRHEMATIMAKLYLGSEAADNYVGTHPFTDVYPWADKYVAACYENGLVSGTSKTTFGGNQPLTAIQAAAMMLRALGYEDLSKGAADWRTPVAAKANQIRLFKDVTANPSAQLTRNEVAQLALNTLKSDVVETERGADVTIGDVAISTSLKYNRVEIASEGTANYAGGTTGDAGLGYQQLCEKLYDQDLKLVSGGSDDLKRTASTWQYKKEDVIKVTNEADYILVVDDNLVAKADTQTIIRELSDKDDLTADASATYYLNGASSNDGGVKGASTYGTVIEVYLKAGESKKYDKVVAYNYTLDQITEVDTEVKDSDAKKGVSAYVTFKNAGTFNNDKIAGYNTDDYVEDAYVAIISDGSSKIIASFIPEVVNGSVSSVKGTKSLTINGDSYNFGVNYTSSSAEYVASVKPGNDSEYDVFVDANGVVLGVKEIEGAAAKLDEVYYVDTVWKTTAGMSTRYYAQVVSLADGTKREVELEEKDNSALTAADLSGATYDANNRIEGDKGKLATVTDKKETDSKAGNDKFNLKKWDNSINDDFDIYTGVKFDMSTPLKLKADDSRVAATNSSKNGAGDATATFRLGGSTQYVFLEKTAADLDVSTVTGGVNYTFSSDNMGTVGTSAGETRPAIVITAADKNVAQYVIIPCVKANSTTGSSKDVIFIKGASDDKGDGHRIQEVYLPDGSKESWEIDESEYSGSALAAGAPNFFTYTENSDGYYELEKAEALSYTTNDFWEDDKNSGALGNETNEATIAAGARTEADGKFYLTVTVNSNTLKDIDVTDAKFVDAHDKEGSGEYDKGIGSLARLCELIDAANDGKAGVNATGTKLYLNVTGDGAQIIILTNAPAKAADPVHTHNYTKTEAVDVKCYQDGCAAYWSCQGCSTDTNVYADDGGQKGTQTTMDALKIDKSTVAHDWTGTGTHTCSESGNGCTATHTYGGSNGSACGQDGCQLTA